MGIQTILFRKMCVGIYIYYIYIHTHTYIYIVRVLAFRLTEKQLRLNLAKTNTQWNRQVDWRQTIVSCFTASRKQFYVLFSNTGHIDNTCVHVCLLMMRWIVFWLLINREKCTVEKYVCKKECVANIWLDELCFWYNISYDPRGLFY